MTSGVNYTISGTSLNADLHWGEKPRDAPKGLFNTRAVQVRDGWLGQLIVDTEIVYESDLHESGENAVNDANSFLIDRIKRLFVEEEK